MERRYGMVYYSMLVSPCCDTPCMSFMHIDLVLNVYIYISIHVYTHIAEVYIYISNMYIQLYVVLRTWKTKRSISINLSDRVEWYLWGLVNTHLPWWNGLPTHAIHSGRWPKPVRPPLYIDLARRSCQRCSERNDWFKLWQVVFFFQCFNRSYTGWIGFTIWGCFVWVWGFQSSKRCCNYPGNGHRFPGLAQTRDCDRSGCRARQDDCMFRAFQMW